ncbi:hypothetical protein [Nitratifractor salsuginis]|uniref:Uncharacterized protein n=1 Tax=Nitratifractor salsuginis (strain DSM 16511 / JCM 12458 / E9I37-1) TaxID=749222 RepID=E6WY47_NITSE|nr:hypothetical protein [Nitratifractor salsuginis]ADV46421.1 hypothetical protein Nitsa_1168 [Nitratifractor salsuginis DSM 16511]
MHTPTPGQTATRDMNEMLAMVFGFTPRSREDAPLTYEQLDANMESCLVAMVFKELAHDSLLELPAINNAQMPPNDGEEVALTPIMGYAAILLNDPLGGGSSFSGTLNFSEDVSGWFYSPGYETARKFSGQSVSCSGDDFVLVVATGNNNVTVSVPDASAS